MRSRRGAEPPGQSRCHATPSGVVIQSECLVALAILAPVLPHLDKQKQVNPPFEHALELRTGAGTDRLDSLPAFVEHDRPLARSLEIDHLLDAHTSVRLIFPPFGFDR